MGRYDEATRRGRRKPPEDPPAAAEPPPHSCAAHGCPLPGSIVIDGARVCFVHLAFRDRADWDAATARVRRRPMLVRADELLRSPGSRTDAMLLEEVRSIVPALSPEHDTRYRALSAIEKRLLELAKSDDDHKEAA